MRTRKSDLKMFSRSCQRRDDPTIEPTLKSSSRSLHSTTRPDIFITRCLDSNSIRVKGARQPHSLDPHWAHQLPTAIHCESYKGPKKWISVISLFPKYFIQCLVLQWELNFCNSSGANLVWKLGVASWVRNLLNKFKNSEWPILVIYTKISDCAS